MKVNKLVLVNVTRTYCTYTPAVGEKVAALCSTLLELLDIRPPGIWSHYPNGM